MEIALHDIKLIQHETAEAVLRAYWGFAGLTDEDLAEGQFGALGENGEEVDLPWEVQVEAIERMGFWGYADYGQRAVHMWRRPEVPHEVLMAFLGHEVAHFLSPHDTSEPDLAVTVAEEAKVDTYGEVAAHACRLLREAEGLPVFAPGEPYTDVARSGAALAAVRAGR